MADQIYEDGPVDAPAKYVVPGSAVIVPIAVQALLNGSGASGDFVPTLIFRSQAGHVIARVPTSTTVSAGGSAEVSWFPNGMTSGGGATTLPQLNQSQLSQSRSATQAIVSGVVTAIAWDGFQSTPGFGSMFGPTPSTSNPVTFAKFATVVITLTVVWPAANFDRYSEIAVGAASSGSQISSPRLRNQISPDGDRQTLTAAILGDPFNPTTITPRVFQASGVNQNIKAGINYYSIPYGVAPYVLP